MSSPTDEFDTLRKLREACSAESADDELGDAEAFNVFAEAAHAALGPEGCVTREMEWLRAKIEELKSTICCEPPDCLGCMTCVWRKVCAERDALKDEVERLRLDVRDLAVLGRPCSCAECVRLREED